MTTQTRSVASGSTSSTSEFKDEVSADANRLKDTATNRAKEEADVRKGQATQTAHSASSALRTAADELEQDRNSPEWLSSAARQAAGGIERFAGEIEGRSPEEIGHNVSRFARENPGTFLAASAAAGFAAARFFRAGADHRNETQSSGYDQSTRSGETAGSIETGADRYRGNYASADRTLQREREGAEI